MYQNYQPSDDYRREDNPHEPTNVPDDLEENCYRVFEHVESWSANAGHVKFVYPKTEEGYDDYEYMLDEMGFEPGAIIDYEGTRLVVLERCPVWVNWGDKYKVETGGVRTQIWSDNHDGETLTFEPGEGYSPKNLWKAYIYGDLELVGHVTD